jgi:hypothetical protein
MAEYVAKMERPVERPAEAIRHYAPPQHADRVSATSRIMCDAIEKVFNDTAAGLDDRVAELKTKVAEIDDGVNAFKAAMGAAANSLIERVTEVMAHYEDITEKLQQSPFNGTLPKFLAENPASEA